MIVELIKPTVNRANHVAPVLLEVVAHTLNQGYYSCRISSILAINHTTAKPNDAATDIETDNPNENYKRFSDEKMDLCKEEDGVEAYCSKVQGIMNNVVVGSI